MEQLGFIGLKYFSYLSVFVLWTFGYLDTAQFSDTQSVPAYIQSV